MIPKPDHLNNLERILQKDLYTSLTGQNPIEKAQYLHDLVYALQGTYTDEGIRRWFQRKRSQLGNQSPLEYLGPHWKPNDQKAQEVLDLAKSLIG